MLWKHVFQIWVKLPIFAIEMHKTEKSVYKIIWIKLPIFAIEMHKIKKKQLS